MVPDDWVAEAFTKEMNPKSSIVSFKNKQSLTEFEAMTWANKHNRYKSKI